MSRSAVTEWMQILIVEDDPIDGQPMFAFDYVDEMPVIRSWPEFIANVGRTADSSAGDSGAIGASRRLLTDPDVILIDFNFEKDYLMPPVEEELAGYREFGWEALRWPDSLKKMRTSGLLIGACLAGRFAFRDFPLTTGVYTGWPTIVESDVPSLLLVAQILALGGYDFQMDADDDYFAICRRTIGFVQEGARDWTSALIGRGRAGSRFRGPIEAYREELVNRATLRNRPFLGGSAAPRLTVDLGSIHRLLEGFDAAGDDKELHEILEQRGLDIEDNAATRRSFDLRSLFLDEFATPSGVHVPLTAFKDGGSVRVWLESLAAEASDDAIIEVMNLILNASLDLSWSEKGVSFKSAISKTRFGTHYVWYQLWGALFAWVDAWCSQWQEKAGPDDHQDDLYPQDTDDSVPMRGIRKRWLEILGCTDYPAAVVDIFDATIGHRRPAEWLARPWWGPRASMVCRSYIERKRKHDHFDSYPVPHFIAPRSTDPYG